MATLKQINANRLNSLKSTGPSQKGKYWSSKNSIKHGLSAKNLIVGEDKAEFENYRDQMLDTLKPSGIFEEQVVFKIIDVGFRLRRVFSIESGLFNQEILTHEIDEYKTKIATSFEADSEDILVLNADKSSRVKGLAFARDCNHGSSLLKLNTIEDKLLNKYFKLMDIYKDMKGGGNGLEKK